MSLECLPQEVIFQITGYLEGDSHTLFSLVLVSRQFRVAGQLALHRKVKILEKSKVPLMRLFYALLERSDLAQQVQVLKMHVHKKQTGQIPTLAVS